jgi:hypothetical protein
MKPGPATRRISDAMPRLSIGREDPADLGAANEQTPGEMP